MTHNPQDDYRSASSSPSGTSEETDYLTGLPREIAHGADNVGFANGDWWGASANTDYVKPSEGGRPGIGKALAWTTGLRPRGEMKQPIDGRTLIPPRTVAHPTGGPVGLDNRLGRTAAGVNSRGFAFPSTEDIAASFVGARQVAGSSAQLDILNGRLRQ